MVYLPTFAKKYILFLTLRVGEKVIQLWYIANCAFLVKTVLGPF